MSLKTKINFYSISNIFILLFAVILIIYFFNIYFSYKLISQINDEGKRINLAGQLRFRCYRLLLEAHKIIQENNLNKKLIYKSDLIKEMNELEHMLNILERGEYDLKPLKYKPSIELYQQLIKKYDKEIKPLLISFINLLQEDNSKILEKIDLEIPEYVNQINLFVDSIVKGYEREIKNYDRNKIISLVVFGFFLTYALYFIIAFLLIPLKEIKKGVKIISEGKLDAVIKVKRKDEIGELAEAFNEMVMSLKVLLEKNWEYARNLENLVAERTKELEKALDKCEYASKAKSEFLANMAHEIRNPLTSIMGFSEILKEELYEVLAENQKEYFDNILFSSQHILQLLNDILDLSKVESGKMELDLSKFSLKHHIYSCISVFKEKAIKNQINLNFEIDSLADIEITADERKLKQILFNLISNAIKFTPEGGSILLKAKIIPQEEMRSEYKKNLGGFYEPLNCDYIEISIEDTGIGIRKEDMPKLFKEFSQLERENKKYQGTGLGLALTKKLVELHKGFIWVESEFGKGSKFIFIIPLIKGGESG